MTETTPSFRQALRFWIRLGLISFGGPAGQIAIMQTELVDRRRWIGQRPFLDALNFCMLLPGPEAQQLATFIGWRLHGTIGGLAAGIAFIVPGAMVLLALSYIVAAHGDAPLIAAAFDGVKPMVVAIIAVALWRIARRTLTGWPLGALAVAAFVGLYFFDVPFPALILGAGLIGASGRLGTAASKTDAGSALPPSAAPPSSARLMRLAAVFLVLWAVPVALIVGLVGPEPYLDIARLFTTAAFVTFGGAYAVLPYIADAAVGTYGWLTPADMVRGLALAETTPGPLILVTQFVGFFAGWTNPGTLSPAVAGTLAAGLTLYVTFLPCFFFIFAGAPYVERLTGWPPARGALTAITAAIVGVMLNLAVFLAEAVLIVPAGLDWTAATIALAGVIALVRFGIGVHWVVLAGAAIGVVLSLMAV
ncbi:MAG: chromate efflux transporter [Inquilinaceae bacterium]